MRYITSAFLLVGLILSLYFAGQPVLRTPETQTVFKERGTNVFVVYNDSETYMHFQPTSQKLNLDNFEEEHQ